MRRRGARRSSSSSPRARARSRPWRRATSSGSPRAVDDLKFETSARTLVVAGKFRRDTLYTVTILAGEALATCADVALEPGGKSEAFVHFPRRASFVKWGAGQGIVERLGAQMVPVEGRGAERLDVRIQKVDPLDRSLWPFPDRGVAVDESERPPGPGEEPKKWDRARPDTSRPKGSSRTSGSSGRRRSRRSSRSRSEEDGGAASFGFDLAPHLAKIAGAGEPGTYLVGLRALEGGASRSWMRVQATDLSLSTLEEPRAVRFAVTSLSTGLPVAGATIRLEGTGRWPQQRLGDVRRGDDRPRRHVPLAGAGSPRRPETPRRCGGSS